MRQQTPECAVYGKIGIGRLRRTDRQASFSHRHFKRQRRCLHRQPDALSLEFGDRRTRFRIEREQPVQGGLDSAPCDRFEPVECGGGGSDHAAL